MDRGTQQRVVRAAKDQRVDVGIEQRTQVLHQHLVRHFTFQPPFLDQRHEQRTGTCGDARMRVQLANGTLIRAALDRRTRANDANVVVARGGGGRLCTRLDDAGNGDRQLVREHRKRERRRRVTSDDDRLGFAAEQQRRDLSAVTLDSARAFAAVRNACRVAEIIDRFVRQNAPQRRHHGKTADAGIEDADGPRVAAPAGRLLAIVRLH